MCYNDPEKLLQLVLGNRDLPRNDLGHTPVDDFEHFCAYTGCSEHELGRRAFAFVKLAYVTAGLSRRKYTSAALDPELQKACTNIGMLLRDRPPGTTADITDTAVLYWDAGKLRGATLAADGPDGLALPVEPEDFLPDSRAAVAEWLRHPTFSFRPSLLEWLESPESGNPSTLAVSSGQANADWMWTCGGTSFGNRDGNDLWTHDGRHVGRFVGEEVYAPSGRYLGEMLGTSRLVTRESGAHRSIGRFARLPPRTPQTNRHDYSAYPMDDGYRDFPAPDDIPSS